MDWWTESANTNQFIGIRKPGCFCDAQETIPEELQITHRLFNHPFLFFQELDLFAGKFFYKNGLIC